MPPMAASDIRAFAQRGFSMIEVLVSIVILVFGLLGLAGMQAVAHQAELESYQRAQALILLNDVVERLNSNRRARGCYAFTDAASGTPYLGDATQAGHLGTPNCSTGYSDSSTKEIADTALAEWDNLLKGSAETKNSTSVGAMIGARGCVMFDAATSVFTIAVAWQGMTDTFTPVVNCANGLYGTETRRRVVWTTVRFATLN